MTKLLIAGAWTEGAATDEISVTSPATGEHLGSVPSATSADLEAEVDEAVQNFRWMAEEAKRLFGDGDLGRELVSHPGVDAIAFVGSQGTAEAIVRAAKMFREETFGPVLPITTFRDDDEALRLANDSDLGLQASVFTSSPKRAFRFVHGIRAGGTRTGWGRIGGKYTLLDMTDLRTAVIDVHQTRD